MLLDLFIFLLLFFSAAIFGKLKIIRFAKEIKEGLLNNFKVFQSPAISDHWKEKYLLKNSLRTLVLSLKMMFLIAVFLLAVFIPLKIADMIFPDLDIFHYLISLRGLILSILPFIAYYLFTKVLSSRKKNNYGIF